jgi:riboflavin kinase
MSDSTGAPTTAADYAANHEIPQAVLKSDLRACRPEIVGPDAPSRPFPIALVGSVQKGFGRGGKDLGCPTGLS